MVRTVRGGGGDYGYGTGASMTAVFEGADLQLVSTVAPSRSIMEVFIDGVSAGLVVGGPDGGLSADGVHDRWAEGGGAHRLGGGALTHHPVLDQQAQSIRPARRAVHEEHGKHRVRAIPAPTPPVILQQGLCPGRQERAWGRVASSGVHGGRIGWRSR